MLPKFRGYSTNLTYEIPERYKKSFFLANSSLFEQVNYYLHRAYEVCFRTLVTDLLETNPKLSILEAVRDVEENILFLEECNSLLEVRFPIQKENGSREIIRGFRAQHGGHSNFKTSLGGFKLLQSITRDEMKATAVLSTYKHSCFGIALSGGAGGIRVAPGQYTPLELQRVIKRYIAEIYSKGYSDGTTDVLEPDANIKPEQVTWISSLFPENYPKNMIVGKSGQLGGVDNYFKMGPHGAFFALDHFLHHDNVLERIGLRPGYSKKSFILHGMGSFGSEVATLLVKSGAICVGVVEKDWSVYNPLGIEVELLLRDKTHPHLKHGDNPSVLANPCDVLLLASATPKSLPGHLVDKIQAKIIVELTAGAITPIVHKTLVTKLRLVLPDIYVSSGYSIGSYLEYLSNQQEVVPVLRKVYSRILEKVDVPQIVAVASTEKMEKCDMSPDVFTFGIEHIMGETGEDLLEIAKEYNLGLDLRTAAYIQAIRTLHGSINNAKYKS